MKNMTEIRWHGRGGQGAKTASLLLADAAFLSGKFVQSFPEYGPERSGAPITAYNRISDERCTIHSNIYEPDYVVVVDETLLETVDVTAGLKEEGAIVINSERPAAELRPLLHDYKAVAVLDKSEGFSACGGPLFAETASACINLTQRPKMVDIVYGLGGRDFTVTQAKRVFARLEKIVSTGEVGPLYSHMGQRDLREDVQ